MTGDQATRREILRGMGVGLLALATACDDDPPATREPNPALDIPDITPNEEFYVTSCCQTPEVLAADWRLTLMDRGVPLREITLSELDALPARDKEHTLVCIGGGPGNQRISNAVWTGLPLLEIFAAFGVVVPAEAVELKLTSADGYSTGLPITDLDRPLWLVWRMNGEPLPPDHGFPVRTLVPGRYGMKNPKWLTGIELVDTHHSGYWESYGWSDDATYLPHTLIRSPGRDAHISAGNLVISGTTFAGSDPVVAVHVRVDGGPWIPAHLDYVPDVADVWVLWSFSAWLWPGAHSVEARCTTASGAMSLPPEEAPSYLNGYGGSMRVELTAT